MAAMVSVKYNYNYYNNCNNSIYYGPMVDAANYDISFSNDAA